MDSEFFELSLLTLEKRYADILVLHDARLNSNYLELEELTKQLEAEKGESLKLIEKSKQLEAEKGESLKLIEKLIEELETKIAAASKVN